MTERIETADRVTLYRTRAREVRSLAENCPSGTIREQLLIVAAEYDLLAEQAEDIKLRN